MLSAVLLVLPMFLLGCDGIETNATVYYNRGHGYSIKFGVVDTQKGVAYGLYQDNINTTGWAVLDVVSGTGVEPVDDVALMYAAGYLEGALTARHINYQYENVFGIFFKSDDDPLIAKAAKFFSDQDTWMRTMIASESRKSPFWRQMRNILAQYDGLMEGYAKYPATDKPLGKFAFQVVNGFGDLLDLKKALMPEHMPDWNKMSDKEIVEKIAMSGHCSVLIKALPAYENLFASHVTWFPYSAMLRIYKHYHLNLRDESTASRKMSFSSYPGCLESLDDFYIMDSKLMMLQTTNGILNKTLYEHVTPESLLSWHRVRLANVMASGGRQWADIVGQYNSGTYNNQYMVLDLKRIQLNKTIEDNALWVVEQIPSLVASGDQTPILRAGYWPSYNIPFYELIYNMSGYPAFAKKHGQKFSYQLAPRAKIFRRDQSKVQDLSSMKHLMLSNDYQHDPYSQGSPWNAICARGDLIEPKPKPKGCYDAKVSDLSMALALTSHALSGPTHQEQKPFRWSDNNFKSKHFGQPDLFNFDFVVMKPDL